MGRKEDIRESIKNKKMRKVMSRMEELERILSEKVEKDEEWDFLEIEDVKLVYVGKLKANLKKLPPQAILLAILVKYFEKFKEVKITKFTKITFEVEKKVFEPILSGPLLSFKADNFGPFTREIYDILGFLQNLDLVKIEKEGDKTEIILTDKGVEVFRERIKKEIPEVVLKLIEIVVERYGSLDHDELLHRVYKEYPEFAGKSVVRDKYYQGVSY